MYANSQFTKVKSSLCHLKLQYMIQGEREIHHVYLPKDSPFLYVYSYFTCAIGPISGVIKLSNTST